MNKLEKEYYAQVKKVLETPEEDRDIEAAAKLMLQGKKNRRLFYHNILRRPQRLASKLWYELKEIDKKGDELAAKDAILTEEKQIVKLATHTVSVDGPKRHAENLSGVRADHDKLPTQVQDYYVKAGELYKEIKAKHAQVIAAINSRDVEARRPIVEELAQLDKTRRELLKDYDEWTEQGKKETPDEPGDGSGDDDDDSDLSDEDIKSIKSARKYLSENFKKLETKVQEDPEFAVAEDMATKLLERYNTLVGFGKATDDQKERLKALGLLKEDNE